MPLTLKTTSIALLSLWLLVVAPQPGLSNPDKNTSGKPHYYVRYIARAGHFSPDNLTLEKQKKGIDDRGIVTPFRDYGMFRYLAIAGQAGPALHNDLLWVFRKGTPSGKLYASLLMRQYDRDTANAQLKALTNQPYIGKYAHQGLAGMLNKLPSLPLPPGEWNASEPELDTDLEDFAFIRVLSSAHVGFGGQTPPEFVSYTNVCKRGASIAPQLEWISIHGTPAAQLLAADCLAKIAPARGKQAFLRLTKSTELTDTQFGCIGNYEPVADFAKQAVRDGSLKLDP